MACLGQVCPIVGRNAGERKSGQDVKARPTRLLHRIGRKRYPALTSAGR